ncbi:MAG: hypothetical protein WAN65_27320, partial [Candidatus Sulfotelmatobacter sp.]
MRVEGSASLLEEVLASIATEPSDLTRGAALRLAQAYEQYGLPDGSLKPLSDYGYLITPKSDQLASAIKAVISDAIPGDSRWLLDVPVGISSMPSTIALTYMDPLRGAAIVLNSLLFSDLY